MLGTGKRTWMSIFPKLGFEKTEDEKYKGKMEVQAWGLASWPIVWAKTESSGADMSDGRLLMLDEGLNHLATRLLP